MKTSTLLTSSLLLLHFSFLLFTFTLQAEEPYEFRRRLETVHQADRRDKTARCAADEIALADGLEIALTPNASELVRRAAADFVDYLSVSMNVDACVTHRGLKIGAENVLSAGLASDYAEADRPKLKPHGYTVSVGPGTLALAGVDERAVAQAFYHLEDLMNLRRAPFLKKGTTVRTPRFDVRMTHSGYGYMMYEEPMLNAMAHAGMTAIIVYVSGIDKISRDRICDQRAVIRCAAKYGLDSYLYAELPAFFHPDDGDAPFDEVYGKVAAAYPDAKGIIIVGESCQFPSKDPRVQPRTWKQRPLPGDPRPLAGWFPCRDYPDWLRAMQRAVGKHAPGMKTIFWTYNWGWASDEDRLALIDALPQNTILQATFEMFERRTLCNGIDSPTADYTLSVVGPGHYFSTEAAAAKRRGLTLFTQANAGGRTWDFGTAPYEPFPFQWRKRWNALVKAQGDYGLSGIMECHHYGWTPTFLAELEKEAYTEGGMAFDSHLQAIAARDFGVNNAAAAVAAWKTWSEAICDYVPTDLNQYGPFRCGPAYPFAAGRGKVDPADFPVEPQSLVGHGFIRMDYLTEGFVQALAKEDSSVPYMKKEVELLSGMVEKLETGAAAFAKMPGAAARRQMLLGRYLAATCRTAKNTKRGWIAAAEKDEAGILAVARDEYANAKAALSLVEEDSHLGFEPDMDYVGGPRQIRWKLQKMEELYGKDVLR